MTASSIGSTIASWEKKLLGWAYEGLESLPSDKLAPPDADPVLVEQAYQHCSTITHTHSRTFFLTSSLLPTAICRSARALYAFCRVSDDLVDRPRRNPRAMLEMWKERALNPSPPEDDLVALAWADTRARHRIPLLYAEQLLDTVAHDLETVRYATFSELADYSYGVASTVGLMAMHIVGFSGPEAIPYAVRLGVALQLTNILRDVGEDWRAGRLYLPLDELAAFDLTEEDIATRQIDERWHAFLCFQMDRVHSLYTSPLPGDSPSPPRPSSTGRSWTTSRPTTATSLAGGRTSASWKNCAACRASGGAPRRWRTRPRPIPPACKRPSMRNTIQAMREELRGWPSLLLLAWLLAMLTLPISNWVWGERALYLHISSTVLLHASLSTALLARAQGIWRTVLTVAIVFVLSWALEAVGAATGIPFGEYHYTNRLQPQVAHVPLLIMAAWMMMLPPAWAIGQRLSGKRNSIPFILISGLAITAWDLFLDPQMVQWELWVWDQPGGYFGIPWVNFFGWFLGGALLTAATRPREIPDRPLLAVYTLTWILETIGLAVFWGLIGPAVCGFVGMGVLIVLAWYRTG